MARRETAGGRFDGFRLAREREAIEGTVDAEALPRVAELLMPGAATLQWRIEGTTDASGRPALTVTIDGHVQLECQRCLGALEWPITQASEVLLARSESELARLDAESELEVLLAEAPLEPAEVVEDELLLTLPFAPRHPEGACAAPAETQ